MLADNARVDPSITTSAFVGTNLENTANFCIASRSRGISAIVSGRLPQKPICGPRGEARIWPQRMITSFIVHHVGLINPEREDYTCRCNLIS